MERIRSNKAAELICSYLLQEQTDADKQELDSWLSENQHNQLYFRYITAPDTLQRILRQRTLFNAGTGRAIWNKISRGIGQSQNIPATRRSWWFRA